MTTNPIPAPGIDEQIAYAEYIGGKQGTAIAATLRAHKAIMEAERPEPLARYDAGIFSSHGGGDVDWWQDYMRVELDRAHEFYDVQYDALLAYAQRMQMERDEARQYDNATKNIIEELTIERDLAESQRDALVRLMREPDEEMMSAARDWSLAKYGQGVGNDGATGCWSAMSSVALRKVMK